jgi:hypothetical protein
VPSTSYRQEQAQPKNPKFLRVGFKQSQNWANNHKIEHQETLFGCCSNPAFTKDTTRENDGEKDGGAPVRWEIYGESIEQIILVGVLVQELRGYYYSVRDFFSRYHL